MKKAMKIKASEINLSDYIRGYGIVRMIITDILTGKKQIQFEDYTYKTFSPEKILYILR